jgi:hypothetical protein
LVEYYTINVKLVSEVSNIFSIFLVNFSDLNNPLVNICGYQFNDQFPCSCSSQQARRCEVQQKESLKFVLSLLSSLAFYKVLRLPQKKKFRKAMHCTSLSFLK